MSICSDKQDKEPGSLQILRHIKKAETPMQDVRDFLINVLKQYQSADKVGRALGVLDKSSSFSDHVSWCSLVAKIDQKKDSLDESGKSNLIESLDYLDKITTSISQNVVNEIQKTRDKWMVNVLLLDLFVIVVMAALAMLMMLWSGVNFSADNLVAVIAYRPVFYTLSAVILISVLFVLHFLFRRRVISGMLEKNQKVLYPGMSMMRALLRNTRARHSIFRPEPVGWNLFQKKRLQHIASRIKVLREQMADVLSHYSDKTVAN